MEMTNDFLKQPGNMEKTFVLMCKQGNIETVRRFLLLGMDPNVLNNKGLDVAFDAKRYDVCQVLIEGGANHNFDNDFYFRSSVVQGNVEFVKYLLSKGVNIAANDGEAIKKTFEFHIKYENPNYFNIAELLIEYDSKSVKKYERDIWLGCVKLMDSASLRLLMEKLPGVNVHYDNEWALLEMAQANNIKTVKMLIEHGADVHAWNDGALDGAIQCGHIDMVKFLVEECGANILANDRKMFTSAAFYERTEILDYLEQKESEIDESFGV